MIVYDRVEVVYVRVKIWCGLQIIELIEKTHLIGVVLDRVEVVYRSS